jgi:hypothetical protein
MADDNDCREAFERHYGRALDPSRILWRRGGTTFAEHIDAEEYVDAGVQRKWSDWQAAWEAALIAMLNDGPHLVPVTDRLPTKAREVPCWVPFERGGGCWAIYSYWHVDDEGPGDKCWNDEGRRLTAYLPSHWIDVEPPTDGAGETKNG